MASYNQTPYSMSHFYPASLPCPALPSKGKKTVALTGAAITLFLHVHANVTI